MKNIKTDKSITSSLESRKGKIRFLLIFTTLHMLLTVLLFLASYSVVMGYADAKPMPASGKLLYLFSQVLQWPLLVPVGRIEFLQDILPVYFGIIFLFLNSLIWALAVLGVLLGLSRLRSRTSVQST